MIQCLRQAKSLHRLCDSGIILAIGAQESSVGGDGYQSNDIIKTIGGEVQKSLPTEGPSMDVGSRLLSRYPPLTFWT